MRKMKKIRFFRLSGKVPSSILYFLLFSLFGHHASLQLSVATLGKKQDSFNALK